MPTIFMFLCAYSSWIRLGSMYFQIMSLEIARSSCFQRRWKKLHPWTALVGNGLLKTTNKCLACATRWECKCEQECSHTYKKNVFVCENQLWINLDAGVWLYDNDLNSDPLAGMKPISLMFCFPWIMKAEHKTFRDIEDLSLCCPLPCLFLLALTPL